MRKAIPPLLALLLALFLLAGCIEPTGPGDLPNNGKADWTVMVYLASDNDLEVLSIGSVDELESVGSTDNVKMVVQWDRNPGYDDGAGDWSGTKRFLVVHDEQKGVIASQELMDLGEKDMASPETLAGFLKWSMQEYPAERYVLVLWDHGGSWPLHTVDETSGSHMTLQTTRQALAEAGFGESNKLDLVVLTQCLMSQAEVAYTFAPYAKVLVASEETIPGFGIRFPGYLNKLVKNPGMNEKELATAIVENYKDYYTNSNPDPFTTLTAIDLEKISAVKDSLTGFTDALKESVGQNWPAIGKSVHYAEAFGTPVGFADVKALSSYDLLDFTGLVKQNLATQDVEQSAASLEKAVKEAVIAEYHGEEHPFATGLAIYFPEDELLYNNSYQAEAGFATETGWDEFVKSYIALEKTDQIAPSLVIEKVSSATTSLNNPLTIYGTATGNNIVALYRTINRVEGSKIFMLNQHPLVQNYRDYNGERRLPEFFDGVNNIDFTWVPMVEVITNGEQQVIAPLVPFGKSDYYFVAQGEYQTKQGQKFDAKQVFDYRTGLLVGAQALIESGNEMAVKYFEPQTGDVFTPYISVFDLQSGQSYLAKTDSIAVTEQGIGMDLVLLAPGQYAIGLFVQDLSGNIMMDTATVQVANQPASLPNVSLLDVVGDWKGDGMGFEIMEDGTCVSTVGLKKNPCAYWFRNNNGLPLISFLIDAGKTEPVFIAFRAEPVGDKLVLTEVFEGRKYVLWKEGTKPVEKEQKIDSALVGKWVNAQDSIEFGADSSYIWTVGSSTVSGTFSASNGSISMKSNGITTQYTYTVSENSLSINNSQGESISFTKAGAQQSPPANSLVGRWYNAAVNEIAVFNANGTYQSYMSGALFVSGTYTISGNALLLHGPYGNFGYVFTINENILSLYDPMYGTLVSYIKTG